MTRLGPIATGLMTALLCPILVAQTPSPAKPSARPGNPKESPAGTSGKKVPLSELTLVSTSAAGKAALEGQAEKQKTKEPASPEPAVVEFHPVGATTSGNAAFVFGKGKKDHGLLHDIHGSVYGVNGAGQRDTGGDVGATSKSGKLSIFVGTEHATATSLPH
jgi:hypothetical protein